MTRIWEENEKNVERDQKRHGERTNKADKAKERKRDEKRMKDRRQEYEEGMGREQKKNG